MPRSRRSFLVASAAAPLGVAAARWLGPLPAHAADADASSPAGVHPEFPTQDPAIVREVVGAAHGNFDRLRELVDARPTLAKASWDWGFGDWESALGAASHMGRGDIAAYLLEHGARPNLFSAAMLGQTDVVRAYVDAAPGIQGTPGPHGITLLAHAKAGGDAAAAVVAYLEEVGGADPRPAVVEVSAEEQSRLLGVYSFGAGAEDKLEVYENQAKRLMLRRGDRTGRNLTAIGPREFFPSGAPLVRIRFGGPAAAAPTTVSVWDPDLVVEAARVRS